MDAEPDPPDPPPANLIDVDTPATNPNPPSTAPPHYHRAQNSCEFEPPSYAIPQSATDTLESPRPGPARFVFDVPLPEPHHNHIKKSDKPRNRNHNGQQASGPSNSKQIFEKMEPPKSPKINQTKYETHFNFDPESVSRRGSESRIKNKQKMEKQEYYKDEVAKLRRQLEAAQVHVTANPLDSASSVPAGRTTIVVQQPSLSLDYGGCSTILIRDGEDGRRNSRVCSDHIQQLLDVTNDDSGEKSVCVLLAGEESEITFHDAPPDHIVLNLNDVLFEIITE
ncbi:unnamed protein product, partial [Leptidea sinapis]